MKPVCALLGEKLAHSYSPEIHAMLGEYRYDLCELPVGEVRDLILHGGYTGMNVTVPYKKTVLPFLNELSPVARETGSVNTVLKREDGSLYGDNTDVNGFAWLLKDSDIEVKNKKALILGSGGSAQSVRYVLQKAGAFVTLISRSGENNYTNLSRHRDARIVVNTTPLGMYPNNGEQAADLALFPRLEGVFDLIYNPARTALLLQAEALGIPSYNGLAMLVSQAKRSSELFQDRLIGEEVIGRITGLLSKRMRNIALIGMPGAGKSNTAIALGKLTGRRVLSCDEEIEKRSGKTPARIITENGEAAFRALETQVLREISKQSGAVLDLGGGCVTREENEALLRQNSIRVWLTRDLSALATENRPLSQGGLEALYEERKPLYEHFSEIAVPVLETPEKTAQSVLERLETL